MKRVTSSARRLVPMACALALALGGGAAHANNDELVQRGLALAQAGKAAEAYALLAPALENRAGDADYDYVLGLAAADSNHLGEAIAAFQRVIAVRPENTQARAELARVYALAGDIDTAKQQFDTVLAEPGIPDPVRQRIGVLSRQFGTAIKGGSRSVTGYAELEGGYDSNVNAATSSSAITFPLFAFLGPATLSGSAIAQDKAFVQGSAGVSLDVPLSRQTKLFASGQGFLREIVRNRAFDQASVGGTLGLAHTSALGDVVSLAANAQNFWLGHTSYRDALGAIAQYTHRTTRGEALSASLSYVRLNYAGDAARDADRYTLTASYAGRAVYASVSSGVEDVRRSLAPNLGFAFTGLQAGIEKALASRVAMTASAGVEHRNYRAIDPLFLAGRRDTQGDIALGLRFLVGEGLTLRPQATYTRNWSNLPLYDYERATVSLALRKEF